MDQPIRNPRVIRINYECYPPPHVSNNESDEEKSVLTNSCYETTTQTLHERSRNSLRVRLNERRINNRYDIERERENESTLSFNTRPKELTKKSKPVSLLSSIEDV